MARATARKELCMTPDDFLWAILGAGALTSIAYIGSEFRSHRTRQALEHERLAQQQLLWPSESRPAVAGPSDAARKAPRAEAARMPDAARGFAVQPRSKCTT
jgi:hypothetical protein